MFLLFVLFVLAISSALEAQYYDVDQAEILFENFTITHNKTYSNEEEKQTRFKIFKDNLRNINEKNSIGSAVFGVNQFSDLTTEEFKSFMGFKFSDKYNSCDVVTDADINNNNAPASINWVEKGAVTAVKNQGNCGSCFTFSTTGNIEAQYFFKTKELLSFSEQEILDCSKNTHGCSGGFMTAAMSDLISIGGVETEGSYPYQAWRQQCQFDVSKAKTKIVGCKNYQLTDEEKLMEVLAKKGPISIALNGGAMQQYHGGIMTKAQCDEFNLDHAVLLVGYGKADDGTAYWLIKNSWGPRWGEEGYVRINRGDNTCGLMNPYAATAEL